MDQIRDFASMLCIAAVACCALKLLLPEGALEKTLKAVLSVFFLLCLLGPLRSLALSPPDLGTLEEAAAPSRENLGEIYARQLERSVAQSMERIVSVRLERLGIPADGADIQIIVNTGGGDRIDISAIEVALGEPFAARAAEVRAHLEKELELPCTVSADGRATVGESAAAQGEEAYGG